MPLFQNSVLKKYHKTLNPERVGEAYQRYVQHFHNAAIQDNIRSAKEEQYQGEFLIDLFVKVLGYTKNPQPDFNLTTELKNVKDGKKADGAILKGETALAVIELKGTDTTDLGKVESQAFGYKNNQPGCTYVVTSNFEKLRFYIDNAVDFEEFHLFELTREKFEILWLCLAAESLLAGVPRKIKEESLTQEEQVTKKLYKDYSAFRSAVFQNISEANPQYDKLLLFKKTQKLLDRFLFIFFAEDRLLLPPNSIRNILQQWLDLKDKYDEYKPLYDRFKKYFNYLNTGHRGKEHDIFAYNGGLFAPDEILDSISIDDTLLFEHTQNLSNYDFESEVSVNILGHIFEHSLTEIENIQAELEGAEIDKSKTKRKKDGVFYTPKYITKYIVENTVGKLCEEKKAELDITDEAYQPAKQRSRKRLQNLQDYRDWLLQLTICDPACGSGAFLNQALEFLIAEHRYIDELAAKYNKDALILSDVENAILENNLFGVDINEESVEIAKLSLWLRTAQRGRKLTSLNDNIKCGNSLIDDPEVAGEKAFNWEQEFPEVFEKGGFDVVIGNPPYVKLEAIKDFSNLIENYGYLTYNKRGDLYVLFVEKGFNVLKPGGSISFIMPNKWLQAGYGKELRKFLLTKYLDQIVDFGDIQIFQGATTYPLIFVGQNKSPSEKIKIAVLKSAGASDFQSNVDSSFEIYPINYFNEGTWVISSKAENNLLEKIRTKNPKLKDVVDNNANRGIIPGLSEAFIIDAEFKDYLIEKDFKSRELIGPILRGRNIKRYGFPKKEDLDFIILAYYDSYKFLEKDFKGIYEHLLGFKEKLKKRGQCNGSPESSDKPYPGQHHWLELDNTPTLAYLNLFKRPKIMYQVLQVKPCFIYDTEGLYCNNSMWIIPTDKKGLVGILNSKMGWWLISKYCTQIQNGYQLIWKYFGEIPIPKFSTKIDVYVDSMMEMIKEKDKIVETFQGLIQSKFALSKPSKKIQNWFELNFAQFIKELQKQKVVLTLGQEGEWLVYFNEQKEKVQALQAQIDQTDREIDQMVYKLYGLTEEEIQIVENN